MTNFNILLLTTISLSILVSGCQSTINQSKVEQSASQSQMTIKPTIEDMNLNQWVYVSELSDEFNYESIDLTKWNKTSNDWGPWSWNKDNVSQVDGNLNIALSYEPHSAKRHAWKQGGKKVDVDLFYKSGIIRSKGYQVYGFYEARMKGIPTFPGSSPAFWIYSLNEEIQKMGLKGKNEGDVTYSEVDIVELQQAEWDNKLKTHDGANVIDMNLHTRVIENGKEIWKRPGKYPALTQNKIHADFDARDEFHVYGANVTPEIITWYIDGKEVAQKPNLYWHLPMHVTLSLGLRYPHVTYNNCPDGLDRCTVPAKATAQGYPSAMQVDWVRVYKNRNN